MMIVEQKGIFEALKMITSLGQHMILNTSKRTKNRYLQKSEKLLPSTDGYCSMYCQLNTGKSTPITFKPGINNGSFYILVFCPCKIPNFGEINLFGKKKNREIYLRGGERERLLNPKS